MPINIWQISIIETLAHYEIGKLAHWHIGIIGTLAYY